MAQEQVSEGSAQRALASSLSCSGDFPLFATEKIVALADWARSEPRDLYDLWYLTSNEGVQLDHLVDAIRQKLEFRNKAYAGLEDAILQKEARLRALWSGRLAYQMSTLPQFDEGIPGGAPRAVRQANLPC